MLKDYRETLDYLYQSLPMFQRIGAAAYKPDLNNTIALCAAIGNPQNKFKLIHVAGTNGKGSTSHMLAATLQSAGYKTGLYTSPHLKEFTERIRIDGHEVEQQFVVDFMNRIQPVIDRIKPSFFELTVAMAFQYFVERKVDVAGIEVGVGGRLDSTNVISPELSVITNISFDHKDLLGDTLPKIASEKAGIIKRGTPVVVSERQKEVEEVFIEKAKSCNATISFASDAVELHPSQNGYNILVDGKIWMENLNPELKGIYQRKNIPGVVASVIKLREIGYSISEESVRRGIEHCADLTGLKGRWQKIGTHPLIICDTGHNQAGISEVLTQIRQTPHQKLHMVFGVVKDKDVGDVVKMLPQDAHYYFCQAKIPRAQDAAVLADMARAEGLKGDVIPDVNQAIAAAKRNAAPEDLVFIGGSTFVVAEVDGL